MPIRLCRSGRVRGGSGGAAAAPSSSRPPVMAWCPHRPSSAARWQAKPPEASKRGVRLLLKFGCVTFKSWGNRSVYTERQKQGRGPYSLILTHPLSITLHFHQVVSNWITPTSCKLLITSETWASLVTFPLMTVQIQHLVVLICGLRGKVASCWEIFILPGLWKINIIIPLH